jgi:hypothetical protein
MDSEHACFCGLILGLSWDCFEQEVAEEAEKQGWPRRVSH